MVLIMKKILFSLALCFNIGFAEDIVLFSKCKCDSVKQALALSCDGLNNEANVNCLLQEHNYIEVLKHLWSEPDCKKRCAWLEKKIDENHPILIFELAEDCFLQNPTLECYLTKTMPKVIAAAMRTLLDARCTDDACGVMAAEQLLTSYQQRIITKLLDVYTLEEIEDYIVNHSDQFMAEYVLIQERVFQPINEKTALPSPKWIFTHVHKSSIQESEFNLIRKKGAQEILGMIH